MHVHILGICGTFMGGLAQLAAAAGHRVTGQDAGVYPPMSTQLEQAGIELYEGYDVGPLEPAPDVVVIGNALSRGNDAVEYVLDRNLPYTSGPQFLAEHVLRERWVLGVAGTHGKTTTASMLAHILEECGLAPGYLIGGVPQGTGVSARLGETPFFVIEADEYDTAFFDKRSKFVHYHPRTVILNNLEFDHADIFDDLAAIQRQFHHLVRTIPGNGLIIEAAGEPALEAVLAQGCWTPRESFAVDGEADWRADTVQDQGRAFVVICEGKPFGEVRWGMTGLHNVGNALAALAAARHAGVPVNEGVAALNTFAGVKRRMEWRGEAGGVTVYDDFAHHPTAITSTLEGARAALDGRIIAVLEPRSNTMRMGVHRAQLAAALEAADVVFLYQPADLEWSLEETARACRAPASVYEDIDALVAAIAAQSRGGDQVIVMSNGAFGGIHTRLLDVLAQRN